MGNAPSSSRSSTPPPEPPQPPRVPPRAHSPPPRDALALMRGRGQSLTSIAQPATVSPIPHHAPPPALPAPKPEVPAQKELPELDVGEAMPGDLEGPTDDLSTALGDWSAARAAMERAIGPLRDRVEGIGREIREHRQERYAAEEEVP